MTSTTIAIQYLNSIPQVGESIRQVPISTSGEYKDRFSAMLKSKKIELSDVDWNLVATRVKPNKPLIPKLIFL